MTRRPLTLGLSAVFLALGAGRASGQTAPAVADATAPTTTPTPTSDPDAGAPTPTATTASTPAPDGGAPPEGATTTTPAAGGGPNKFRYANTWDLNLEGGGGYVTGDVDKGTGFLRARPGMLIVRDDNFYQFGPTAEYLGVLRRPAFGFQVEYLHLQVGGWLQLGGSLDTKGRPGGMAALGLSVFGVEAQVREFDQGPDLAVALLGKIRIPVGILVYALRTRK